MSRSNTDHLYQNLVADDAPREAQLYSLPNSFQDMQYSTQLASQTSPQTVLEQPPTYVNTDFLAQFRRTTEQTNTASQSEASSHTSNNPQPHAKSLPDDPPPKFHGLLPQASTSQQPSSNIKRSAYEEIPDEYLRRMRSSSHSHGGNQTVPQQHQPEVNKQGQRLKFDPRTGLFVPSLRPNSIGGVPSSTSSNLSTSFPRGHSSPTRTGTLRRDQELHDSCFEDKQESAGEYSDGEDELSYPNRMDIPPPPSQQPPMPSSVPESKNLGVVKCAPLDPNLERWAKQAGSSELEYASIVDLNLLRASNSGSMRPTRHSAAVKPKPIPEQAPGESHITYVTPEFTKQFRKPRPGAQNDHSIQEDSEGDEDDDCRVFPRSRTISSVSNAGTADFAGKPASFPLSQSVPMQGIVGPQPPSTSTTQSPGSVPTQLNVQATSPSSTLPRTPSSQASSPRIQASKQQEQCNIAQPVANSREPTNNLAGSSNTFLRSATVSYPTLQRGRPDSQVNVNPFAATQAPPVPSLGDPVARNPLSQPQPNWGELAEHTWGTLKSCFRMAFLASYEIPAANCFSSAVISECFVSMPKDAEKPSQLVNLEVYENVVVRRDRTTRAVLSIHPFSRITVYSRIQLFASAFGYITLPDNPNDPAGKGMCHLYDSLVSSTQILQAFFDQTERVKIPTERNRAKTQPASMQVRPTSKEFPSAEAQQAVFNHSRTPGQSSPTNKAPSSPASMRSHVSPSTNSDHGTVITQSSAFVSGVSQPRQAPTPLNLVSPVQPQPQKQVQSPTATALPASSSASTSTSTSTSSSSGFFNRILHLSGSKPKAQSKADVKTRVRYLGAFPCNYGFDARAFDDAIPRYHAKQEQSLKDQSEPVSLDLLFNQQGVTLEEKDRASRFYPAKQITFAGTTPLPLVFGFVTSTEQGSICHLVTGPRVSASTTYDILQESFGRLVVGGK